MELKRDENFDSGANKPKLKDFFTLWRAVPQFRIHGTAALEVSSAYPDPSIVCSPINVVQAFASVSVDYPITLRLALRDIESLALYVQSEEPAWQAIDPHSVHLAQELMKRLYSLVSRSSLPWRTPLVSSDGAGAVSFEWWRNDRALTIYVVNTAPVQTLFSHGPRTTRVIESGLAPSDGELISLWMLLIGNE